MRFAGERPVPRRPHAGPSSWRSPANPTQAALAADLIMASLIHLLAVPKPDKNDKKLHNSANTHPNHTFLTGNSTSRPGEGFGTGPGPSKLQKNTNKSSFGSAGTVFIPSHAATWWVTLLQCWLCSTCHTTVTDAVRLCICLEHTSEDRSML